MTKHYDVLIIGAGLSGIGMACQLAKQCPNKTVGLIERRKTVGGTWDLFRYPGVRSDSDMATFGYHFKPWTKPKTLADGSSIRSYLQETAKEFGIYEKISFGIKITQAKWHTSTNEWTLTAIDEASGVAMELTCNFLVCATGYYNHDEGYLPKFAGAEDFAGTVIHPQKWPENVDYTGKRVVVIGSGATAVTLLPAMADKTEHITMLQRSPSYMYCLAEYDRAAMILGKFLPEKFVYKIIRHRNILFQRGTFILSQRFPKLFRAIVLKHVKRKIGNQVDMRHFSPSYMPWAQRFCAVSNGDLFKVLREKKATVVTDQIERFTKNGILLKSGKELPADIIVSATGLKLQSLGGIKVTVDGQEVQHNLKMTYKAVLIQDIPNMAYLFGYTNSSWTLKTDLASDYLCRLINKMEERGAKMVSARADTDEAESTCILSALQSGYIARSGDFLPRQGKTVPWQVSHHLGKDRAMFKQGIEDNPLTWD